MRRGYAALASALKPPGGCRYRQDHHLDPGGVITWVRISPGCSRHTRPGVMSNAWMRPKPHRLTVVSASRVLASSCMKRIPLGAFDHAAVRLARLDGLSGAGCQEEIQRGAQFAAEFVERVAVEAGYPLAGRNRPITIGSCSRSSKPLNSHAGCAACAMA